MSFPRYPKYKPSGVEWLGEVPEGWEVDRIKRSVLSSKNGVWGAEPQQDESDIPCVRVADFDRQRLRVELSDPTIRNVVESERVGRVLCKGDLLLEKAGGGDLQPVGCVVLYDDDRPAVCSNFVARVQVAPGMHASYWCYVHAAAYAVRLNTRSIKQTSGIQNLDGSQYFDERAAFPPLPEQTAIAEFLDRETGKIDELVAKQRRLMELLKEKRQAVISQAVTKGLNPHAPMKPSGIEWLGDVPVGWEVKPLRSVFKFSKGLTITKEDLRDEGVFCVNYGEIHSKYGFRLNPDIHPLRCVEPECLSSNPDALIRDGDFVFADTSEDLEGSGNFTHLISENPIFAGYHTIIARPRKGICPLLLAYQCHSSVFRSQIQRQVKGVKVFSISQGILKSAKCWLPPLPEQTAIAEFLDTELAKFDTLTAEAQRAIDLLQERRTALISAAVTGQIDVREHPRT